MSKTDPVARFSLIFARKVHFSENSSVRENFRQKPAVVIRFAIRGMAFANGPGIVVC